MKSFAYSRPTRIGDAAEAASAENTLILAGGTTMVDLMKIGVQTPMRWSTSAVYPRWKASRLAQTGCGSARSPRCLLSPTTRP